MNADFDDIRQLAASRWPNECEVVDEHCFLLDAGAFRAEFFRAPGDPEGDVCVRAKVLEMEDVRRAGAFAVAAVQGNYFWGGTRGATLSVGRDGALWLTERREAAELADAESLEECLSDFALTIDDWRERSALYE